MQKFIIVLLFAFAFSAKAQNLKDSSGRNIGIVSSIGVGLMDKSFTPGSGNSVQTSTGLEVKFCPHSSAGGAISFDSYGYEKSGTAYNLSGTLRATALALFYRYRFTTGALQPYLKAGGGGVHLSVPTVTVGQGMTTIKKEAQNVGVVLAEAGLLLRIHPRYSLLFGAERDWMSKSTLLDNSALRTTTLKLGLISSF